MEEEKTSQTEEDGKELNLKFSLWFYIALALCILVFIIVSAVTATVCYWAAALGFAAFFAQFLLFSIKTKRALLIVVTCVCGAAFALLFALWIMGIVL